MGVGPRKVLHQKNNIYDRSKIYSSSSFSSWVTARGILSTYLQMDVSITPSSVEWVEKELVKSTSVSRMSTALATKITGRVSKRPCATLDRRSYRMLEHSSSHYVIFEHAKRWLLDRRRNEMARPRSEMLSKKRRSFHPFAKTHQEEDFSRMLFVQMLILYDQYTFSTLASPHERFPPDVWSFSCLLSLGDWAVLYTDQTSSATRSTLIRAV